MHTLDKELAQCFSHISTALDQKITSLIVLPVPPHPTTAMDTEMMLECDVQVRGIVTLTRTSPACMVLCGPIYLIISTFVMTWISPFSYWHIYTVHVHYTNTQVLVRMAK